MRSICRVQLRKKSCNSSGWTSISLLFLALFFLFGLKPVFGQSIYTVNSLEDHEDIDLADTICADKTGMCTLRAALQNAKKFNHKSKVDFDIEGCGPFTIVLGSNLPKITSPIDLDATTQTGYTFRTPQIVLDGSNVVVKMVQFNVEKGAIGLNLIEGSDGSSIKGFVIGGFRGVGVFISSDNNLIQRNFLGINAEGDLSFRNTTAIFLKGTQNLVGGEKDLERNVISGNGVGVFVNSKNRIIGNFIGTSLDGNSALGNDWGIAMVRYSKFNLISNNLISGNKMGIDIPGDYNEVYSNKIGTNSNGNASIKNQTGIRLVGAKSTRIGGRLKGNLISGNDIGIYFFNSPTFDTPNKNEIKGNLIGLDISGNRALGNETGIRIDGSNSDVIGGHFPDDRNIISGNFGIGIELNGVKDFLIQGNFIGSDVTGQIPVPNAVGIQLEDKKISLVTGESTVVDNLISGNLGDGIEIKSIGQNAIGGNFIGSTIGGKTALPNCGNGIKLFQIEGLDCIGGPTGNISNLIAFNNLNGIEILQNDFNSEFVEILNQQNRIFNNVQSDLFSNDNNSSTPK